MSGPRGSGWSDPAYGTGGYPPNTDPAYSGYWGPPSYPGYGVPQGVPQGVPPTQPTQQIPPYWQAGGDWQTGSGYPSAPPPPEPPKKPSRWLWAAAAAAGLLVIGLVLALVIVSNSSKNSTVVAPPTSTSKPAPQPTTTSRTPPTRTTTLMPAPLPIPTEIVEPPESGVPTEDPPLTGTETVLYTVNGDGRAINITYVDTGGIMQTEFNVALPWSKEVSLSAPAKMSASVAVVNIGRDVTCTVSVNGAQIRQRTGQGLTICTGAA